MKKSITIAASAFTALALCICSCSKDSDTSIAANQEKIIETLVNSLLSSNEGAYAVYNDGATRVVFNRGESSDSLAANGSATLYYAGFTLPSAAISTANLFVTNYKEFAEAASWSVSDSTVFQSITLSPSDNGLLSGIRKGLVGVHKGEESVILFTSRYGFGGKQNGTINAHSALAYHLWVEDIKNDIE